MTLQPPDLLPHIRQHPCAPTHYEVGRHGYSVTEACLHNTEATDTSVGWLSGDSNPPASIHVIIQRDGSRDNIVPYADTAWHVGYAVPYVTRYNSLGCELANASRHNGPIEPYPAAQLNAAAHWLAGVRFSYGISWAHVWCHWQIAVWPPNPPPHGKWDRRRYDPSFFPWPQFVARVEDWLAFMRALPADQHHIWII